MNRFGRIDSHDAALAYLTARLNYERAPAASYDSRSFRLERMQRLAQQLPVDVFAVPVIHVAGTKGKGSTSAMLAAVLTAAGYRTGLYSSPHLYRLEERFAIDGSPSSADELTELTATVAAAAESLASGGDFSDQPPLTYFELTTAMAMLHFARRDADIAVLEVGLGGRLDSTNICRPLASVITSVSHDHTRLLGETIAEIAAEKAGIIKPDVPVVSGVVNSPAKDVIAQTARMAESRLIQATADFDYRYTSPRHLERRASPPRLTVHLTDPPDGWPSTLDDLELGLLGRHQAANAAVAVATLAELVRRGWAITPVAIRNGLAAVRWPARGEVLQRQPTVVVDAAHNVASVAALLDTLDESFTTRRRVLVFGTSGDKPTAAMLAQLLPVFDEVIFTRYLDSPRAVAPEELQQLARDISDQATHVCATPTASWQLAQQLAGAEDLICVTGSCFIAAQVRAVVLEEHRATLGQVR